MPKMRYTKEDLLKSKPIEPGWYPAECTGYEVKPSKGEDKSTNWTFAFKFLEDAKDSRGNDLGGAKVYRLFNEKGMGFAASFIEVITGQPANVEGGEFDPDEARGKRLMVYVTNEMYQGRMQNRVEDFRPIG